jgi:hypothetical protein
MMDTERNAESRRETFVTRGGWKKIQVFYDHFRGRRAHKEKKVLTRASKENEFMYNGEFSQPTAGKPLKGF